MKHEEEMKKFVQQQEKSVQEFQMKLITMQPSQQVAPPHIPAPVDPENSLPSHPSQMYRSTVNQEGDVSAIRCPPSQNVPSKPNREEPMNIARATAVPQQAQQQLMNDILHEAPSAGKPLTTKTPEEKHQMTVDKAQQQLQELRSQMQRHQLNESVSHQGKEQLGSNHREHEQTG